MSTNISLETGKLTYGHRTSFRSTTYRVIDKKYKYNQVRQKNNDVLMTSHIMDNTAQADDISHKE